MAAASHAHRPHRRRSLAVVATAAVRCPRRRSNGAEAAVKAARRLPPQALGQAGDARHGGLCRLDARLQRVAVHLAARCSLLRRYNTLVNATQGRAVWRRSRRQGRRRAAWTAWCGRRRRQRRCCRRCHVCSSGARVVVVLQDCCQPAPSATATSSRQQHVPVGLQQQCPERADLMLCRKAG
eukprot:363895-Chlamydomonas_euryale.AAC.7